MQNPPRLSAEEEEFISESKASFLSKNTLIASSLLYIMLALLICFLIWAYFAEIHQTTSSSGKVVAASEDKIVQSLDGGIVAEILVKEGNIVAAGQPLIKLDDTRYASDYRNGNDRYLVLSAMVARFAAEAGNLTQITFPPDVQQRQDLVKLETTLFLARRDAFQKEIENLENSLKLATDEFYMFEKLVNKHLVSRLDFDRAKRNVNEIQGKILEKQHQFRENALTSLNLRRADLASLSEQLITLRDKMAHTLLRSPIKGIVKKINVNSVGAVINPSMTIIDIVPLSDNLIIETKIPPKDIAFIHVGQKANIKITAYDYSIYGSLEGRVTYVSADTIDDPKLGISANPVENPQNYYVVRIQADQQFLGNAKHPLPILPGMMANVQIMTGKKTVLDYLLKPLLKAKEEALRER